MNRTAPASSRTVLAASIAILALLLAACTGSPDTTSSGSGDVPSETATTSAPGAATPSGSDPSSASTASTAPAEPDAAESAVVEVSAVEFTYIVSTTEVPAGTVVFELRNDGGADHDLVLEGGPGGATAVIGPQETATLSVDLDPGTYTLYCSIGNHRALGMEFQITVS